MKRSIIYVFGPKRLAHQYRESINVQNSQDSCISIVRVSTFRIHKILVM